MTTPTLPEPFAALAPFCATWVLPDSNARHARRLAMPYPEIKTFYDAMLAVAPAREARTATQQPLVNARRRSMRVGESSQAIDGCLRDAFTGGRCSLGDAPPGRHNAIKYCRNR